MSEGHMARKTCAHCCVVKQTLQNPKQFMALASFHGVTLLPRLTFSFQHGIAEHGIRGQGYSQLS